MTDETKDPVTHVFYKTVGTLLGIGVAIGVVLAFIVGFIVWLVVV